MSISQILKQRICDIISTKKTNLVFSADLEYCGDILNAVNALGKHLLAVKLHSDLMQNPDFHDKFYTKLAKLSAKYNFLIIEDRKLCDIGSTVKAQSKLITGYADLITVHGLPGPGILDGVKENCVNDGCGLLLIAQMSCQGNLLNQEYTKQMVEMAKNYSDIVVGFISQQHLDSNFYHFAPGVNLGKSQDSLKQGYSTPEYMIDVAGVDALIVGRGLCDMYNFIARDPNCDETDSDSEFDHQTELCNTAKKYIYTLRHSLAKAFVKYGVVKYGDFTLKSGEKSSCYVDCRMLMGFPKLYARVAAELAKEITAPSPHCRDDTPLVITGVPMGAISLATLVSQASDLPMIMVRDSEKTYGMKRMIEGNLPQTNNSKVNCVVIEDVLTTGGSVMETIAKLETNGYKVIEVLAILDREKGALDTIRNAGYNVKTLFTLSDLTD